MGEKKHNRKKTLGEGDGTNSVKTYTRIAEVEYLAESRGKNQLTR